MCDYFVVVKHLSIIDHSHALMQCAVVLILVFSNLCIVGIINVDKENEIEYFNAITNWRYVSSGQ